jgi:hypothetical protein
LIDDQPEIDEPPAEEPLTFASYISSDPVEVFLEFGAIGSTLPQMPLFLDIDRYFNVPLERTYEAAFSGEPKFWREVLERR